MNLFLNQASTGSFSKTTRATVCKMGMHMLLWLPRKGFFHCHNE